MNNVQEPEPDQLALIAEFDEHAKAELAGHALKKEGFDMANVSVVGADWLGAIGHKGLKTPREGGALGFKIGAIALGILGFLVSVAMNSGHGLRHMAAGVLSVTAATTIGGALIGACLGRLFGFIGTQDEAPDWAENEYGTQLRMGAFLLILYGGPSHFDRAIIAMGNAHPVSVRVRPAKDV